MAKLASIGLILIISSLLTTLTPKAYARNLVREAEEEPFLREVCAGKEKMVKLHFYVQDLRIGHVNTTVYEVAKASITDKSPFGFGSVHVLDDVITEKPAFNSRTLGRIQGLTTNSDLATFGVAMNLNIVFTAGPFAGSSLSILGRNQVMDNERELPIAGGTGAFRFTRGYAIQTSYSMDAAASYAVLEYNIYTTYNSKFTTGEVDEIAQM